MHLVQRGNKCQQQKLWGIKWSTEHSVVKHKGTDNQLNIWKYPKETADLDQNNI